MRNALAVTFKPCGILKEKRKEPDKFYKQIFHITKYCSLYDNKIEHEFLFERGGNSVDMEYNCDQNNTVFDSKAHS